MHWPQSINPFEATSTTVSPVGKNVANWAPRWF